MIKEADLALLSVKVRLRWSKDVSRCLSFINSAASNGVLGKEVAKNMKQAEKHKENPITQVFCARECQFLSGVAKNPLRWPLELRERSPMCSEQSTLVHKGA